MSTQDKAAPTDEQILAAARAMNKLAAEACNVDEADHWNLYGNSQIIDAGVILRAALASTQQAEPIHEQEIIDTARVFSSTNDYLHGRFVSCAFDRAGLIAFVRAIEGYAKLASAQRSEPTGPINKENQHAQLDTDSDDAEPGQQRQLAGPVALGQPMGSGPNEGAGNSRPQGAVALTKQAEPAQAAVPLVANSVAFSDLFTEQFDALAGSAASDLVRDAARLSAAHAWKLAAQPREQAAQPTEPAKPAEAVAWLYQHGETGRFCFCQNDGVNTRESFEKDNPRHIFVCPLYRHPAPAQAPLTDEQTKTHAALWRLAVRKGLITVHSERLAQRDESTRVSWIEGHVLASDISNEAAAWGVKLEGSE